MKALLSLSLLAGVSFGYSFDYPLAPKDLLAESSFGVTYEDPYRWMESSDDYRLYDWLDAQENLTESYFADSVRDEIIAEIEEAKAREATPISGRRQILRKKGRNVRNFYQMFRPGASDACSETPSPSGRYIAKCFYDDLVSNDLRKFRIFDVEENSYLHETLTTKGGYIVWDEDETSFMYFTMRDGRIGGTGSAIYRHKLSSPQTSDVALIETNRPAEYFELGVNYQGNLTLMTINELGYRVEYFDARTNKRTHYFSLQGSYIWDGSDETGYYFIDYRNPMGSLVHLDAKTLELTTLVPAKPWPIDWYKRSSDAIYGIYLDHVASKVIRYPRDGSSPMEIPLPGAGTVLYLYESDGGVNISYNDYEEPDSDWFYDFQTQELTKISQNDSKLDFEVEAQRTYYKAHDGKLAAIWLVKKKGTPLNKHTPIILYGYGGFKNSLLPYYYYTKHYAPWLTRGGAFAIVALPGGLEYGMKWRNDGTLLNKKNVFEDFASAGRHLIERGYTSSEKLAMEGGSNGGLLVGAVMNLYPDLFKAAVPAVGVMDLLRYQYFGSGANWIPDYGDRNQKEHFFNQLALSPYHNLDPSIRYPATMVVTADFDDRVAPMHSYKYLARLQEYQSAHGGLALLDRRKASDHGGSDLEKEATRNTASVFAFLLKELNVGE
jgi:prolyl oligopeptidase